MLEMKEKTKDFHEKGGYRTHDFPMTYLGMESEGERRLAASSFLRTLLGEDAKKVRWYFRNPSFPHVIPPEFDSLEEAWSRLESLNSGGANIKFAPILGQKWPQMGRPSFIPPPFFVVDVHAEISELGGTPEELLESIETCQALELPFTYCVTGKKAVTLYWAVDQELPLYLWSAIQGHLTEAFGAGPASLLPSKSRLLPGMLEWRDGWKEYPHVLQSMSRPYGLEEFAAAFGMGIVSTSDLEVGSESGFPWGGK
jgi:hypothetical protein